MCEGCREHLDQIEVTVRVLYETGRVPEPGEAAWLNALLDVFRDWKRAQP